MRPAMLFALELVPLSKRQERGRAGGGRVKDVEILFTSDEDGQN